MMNLSDFFGKKICVAVSGGVDSVALLHYLKTQEKALGYRLSAVHCEHGIRGEESLLDARFVSELCAEWNVPLFTFSEDCPARAKREKESLETAARRFRYESFSSLIAEKKADLIATAHHKNDEAETVLFRLARGTSLSGVGGMYEVKGSIIRPFLDWTRAEIEIYAKKNGLLHREDKTNAETEATRNKLRLDILPRLENAVPGAAGNLVRFARLATEDDALLYEYATPLVSFYGEEVGVDFCEKKPLFRRACLIALKALGVERDYTALHLENIYVLQASKRGAKLKNLPQGIEAEKMVEGIVFRKIKSPLSMPKGEMKKFDKKGFDGGRYEVKVSQTPIEAENEWNILRVDGEKIPKNAVFRFRKEGDVIERFGTGSKTLKKFFNEEKIPVSEREYLPLIADRDNREVYVVCGVEISEKVKVEKDAKETLYIGIRKKD